MIFGKKTTNNILKVYKEIKISYTVQKSKKTD